MYIVIDSFLCFDYSYISQCIKFGHVVNITQKEKNKYRSLDVHSKQKERQIILSPYTRRISPSFVPLRRNESPPGTLLAPTLAVSVLFVEFPDRGKR